MLYNTTQNSELFPLDREARSWNCRWFQELMDNGFLMPQLIFFLAETCIYIKWESEQPE
jgi:hypothetical protein